jgi:hypothetical protein
LLQAANLVEEELHGWALVDEVVERPELDFVRLYFDALAAFPHQILARLVALPAMVGGGACG